MFRRDEPVSADLERFEQLVIGDDELTRALWAQTEPQARPVMGFLPRGISFWVLAVVLGLLVFASSAPSPLYGVYQQKWQFSATTLTAIFGVYALALIATANDAAPHSRESAPPRRHSWRGVDSRWSVH